MNPPPTTWTVIDSGEYELAESAVIHDGSLYFVDLLAGRVWRRPPHPDGASVTVTELTEPVGAVLPTPAGTLTLVHGLAVSRLRDDVVTGTVRLPGDPATHRVNDAILDPWGRVWVGVMPYRSEERTGCVYLVDGTDVTLVRRNLGIPNGFGLSPDGRHLYHVETLAQEITVFDIASEAGRPQAITSFGVPGPGLPDGLTVDCDGHLWVAMWGGSCVVRLTGEGRLLSRLELPCRQPTSCACAGDALFVTSARLGLGANAGPSDGAVLMTTVRRGDSG